MTSELTRVYLRGRERSAPRLPPRRAPPVRDEDSEARAIGARCYRAPLGGALWASPKRGSLERNIVFRAATATGGGRFEVAHVSRDVALGRGETATTAVAVSTATGAVAGSEELD